LLPALWHVLAIEQRFSTQRCSHIVLITDGQIANEEAVLKEVSGHSSPVHCFGIDHAVNEAFLRQLAGQQRGTSAFLAPDDDLVRPVAILGSRLGRPVFADLTWMEPGSWLTLNCRTSMPVRWSSLPSERRTMHRTSILQAKMPLAVSLETQAVETDLPKLTWMKRRIGHLLQDGKDVQARALAKEANLVCRGTVFVAWDDAEKVAIAQNEVYQPSFNVSSGLLYSRRRASSSDSTMNFFESRVTEYQKAPLSSTLLR
jgi:von Willebrand factor type A domain